MNRISTLQRRPKCRWFQWRLRTLLIGLTIVCIALGAVVDRAARQRRATEWLAERGFRVVLTSTAPEWMPTWLDRKLFNRGFYVDNFEGSSDHRSSTALYGPLDSEKPIPNIEIYFLLAASAQGSPPLPLPTNLTRTMGSRLFELRDCRVLSLREAQISDDGLHGLGNLSRLEYLDLSDSTLGDDDLSCAFGKLA